MKRIIRLIVTLACGLALFIHVGAQDRTVRITPTYRFEFKIASKTDTVTTLYCVLKTEDILNFQSINVIYNNKSRTYFTKNLLNEKSTEFFLENAFVYIRIMEQLDDPFVIIIGVDKMGRHRIFNQQNSKGKTVNPSAEEARWKKAKTRIDSMDYVRRYDNVFVGKDGKPRFRDNKGTVYVIDKDHIYPDHN